MEDLFKKFVYTGVGLVSLTTEKLQKSVDKLVDENKISTEEGKKIVEDLFKKTEGKKEEFENQLKKVTEEVVNKFQIPRNKEIEALQKRVAALEAKVGKASATTKTKSAS
ncbi:MAG: phasin family protein [Bacteroidota bacterium]